MLILISSVACLLLSFVMVAAIVLVPIEAHARVALESSPSTGQEYPLVSVLSQLHLIVAEVALPFMEERVKLKGSFIETVVSAVGVRK